MKIQDKIYNNIQENYKTNGHEFEWHDIVTWKTVIYILPYILLLPLYFWFLKFIFINILLYRRGFEETLIMFGIIFMVSPMIRSVFDKFSDLALEIKYK